jgi:hypothetical protein
VTAVDDLIDQMAHLLGAPCTLEDPDFRLLGYSQQRSAVDPVRQRSIMDRESTEEIRRWFRTFGIQDAVRPVRTPRDPERGIEARLCIPARHLGRLSGYFWVLDPDEQIGAEKHDDALRLAAAAAALLDLASSRQNRRDALYREVVEAGRATAQHAAETLASGAAIDLAEPVRCVLVDRPELADQIANRPSRAGVALARDHGAMVAAVARSALLGAPGPDADVLGALGLTPRDPLGDEVTVVAVGPEVATLDQLDRSRAGALVALRVARARSSSILWWESLGALRLLAVARDDDLHWATTSAGTARFLREASLELRQTAEIFLAEGGSVGRTAKRLLVHRQTIYHRIGQIEAAAGIDLSRGDDRLHLHLALLLDPHLGAG